MEDFKETAIREYEDEVYNSLHPTDDDEDMTEEEKSLTAEEEDFVLEVARDLDYDKKAQKKFSEMTEVTLQRLVELDMVKEDEVTEEMKEELERELQLKYGDLD